VLKIQTGRRPTSMQLDPPLQCYTSMCYMFRSIRSIIRHLYYKSLKTQVSYSFKYNQQDVTFYNIIYYCQCSTSVFLNRRAAARYRALASIIPGRERPEGTTVCYKISLVQLITNLNVILYLSTCHTVHISVLILFMIMP